jgi:hypothetical protein
VKKDFSWESLVWIIVWVSILAFAVLWILNLILFSNSISEIYSNTTRINILKDNATNVVKKLNTSLIKQNEAFYLYKNSVAKTFTVFTGAINEWYKYMDINWNLVTDLPWYKWAIYARLLWLQREDTSIANTQNQIIKASIRKLIKKSQYY